jgi:hypothetical protein
MPVTRPEVERIELLDLSAIAERCGVSKFTPQQWRQRDVLPPVDFPEVDVPLWRVSTIRRWARDTDRDFRSSPKDVRTAVVPDSTNPGIPSLAFSAPD